MTDLEDQQKPQWKPGGFIHKVWPWPESSTSEMCLVPEVRFSFHVWGTDSLPSTAAMAVTESSPKPPVRELEGE